MSGTAEQSDDEFLKTIDSGEVVETSTEKLETEEKVESTDVVDTSTTTTEEKIDKTASDDENKSSDQNPVDSSVSSQTKEESTQSTETTTDKSVEVKEETKPIESVPDYEGFYKKVMAPFKANGRQIDLKDPTEAIQLMQMGANYTRKMQELQPHRKMLLMLQNNGLMDEEKLSFLIDLEKRNPEAIKKLVKDAGIDPLDIDTSGESSYRTGNHKVTDDEANFRQVLDEIGTTLEGKQTLQHINDGWDQASKEVLWKRPELMTTMHNQREAGVYQIIYDEIQRQRTLGKLPANTTFLSAYEAVGDQLLATNAFDHLPAIQQLKPTKQATPVAVTVRTPTSKPVVKNGDKVNAASQSRTTPRSVTTVAPLSMSDEDFLKQMANRV